MENLINFLILEELANENNIVDNVVELILPLIETPEEYVEILALGEAESPVRNLNYFEEVIPRYPPQDFYEHFRMSRNVMEILIQQISPRMNVKSIISTEKKILFTVWMMAKPESYLACCDRFGISKGTGHLIFYEVCGKLNEMIPEEFQWPSPEKCILESNIMENRTGFPGIIGSIDGCHIPIKAPANNPIDYYNRKSFHSVVLQGVCDSKLRFTDIFVGMPGRVHDARVFRVSPLYNLMTNQEHPLINHNFHILGDSAYPLMNNLLVPFRDNGHLTAIQTNFNTVLSTARSKIEQAFGRLKGKFRRLKYLDVNLENTNTIVAAACVLHNFIISRDDDDGVVIDHEIEEMANEENFNEVEDDNMNVAVQKRNLIMEQIY